MKFPLRLILGILLFTFFMGNASGFLMGFLWNQENSPLASFFQGGEEKALVEKPKRFSEKGVEFLYPANWTIESNQKETAQIISVETPGSAIAVVVVFGAPTSPAINVRNQAEAYVPVMVNPDQSLFDKWGQFAGQGLYLKGPIMNISSVVRFFSAATETNSFVVTEQFYDEHASDVAAGFELLQKSFRLTN